MKIGHVDWLLNRIEELEEERDDWTDTAYFYYMTNQVLREQNKRYKQALENITISPIPLEIDDAVNIARQALKGE